MNSTLRPIKQALNHQSQNGDFHDLVMPVYLLGSVLCKAAIRGFMRLFEALVIFQIEKPSGMGLAYGINLS